MTIENLPGPEDLTESISGVPSSRVEKSTSSLTSGSFQTPLFRLECIFKH